MEIRFIWPILQQIDSIWLTVALLGIFFFFFFVKVKFQKQASLKAYGILFYSFVFYAISSLSFVLLNATDVFFRLNNDVFSNYLWFFPFVIIIGFFGAFVGWLIFFAGTKIAEPYVFKLMNISLIIIAPSLAYAILLKPILQTLQLAVPAAKAISTNKEINHNLFEVIDIEPNIAFESAIPTQLFDSLRISIQNGTQIKFQNNSNGFTFLQPSNIKPIVQAYVITIPKYKLLSILALTPAIQGQSTMMVIDSLGLLIYSKNFENGVNRMSRSADGNYILLQKEIYADSLIFASCIKLKP